jgi:hypothetical protein
MNFEEQLACLGKNRNYIIGRLKKVYPHWDIYKEIYPDKDHEWIVGMCLDTAWRRAASDEFHDLLKARFCHNQWLAPWYQSYIGGVPDPTNIFTSKWVYEQLHYNRENIKTSERAREWAEATVGIRSMTNRLVFRGIDETTRSAEWLDQVWKC